MKKIYCFHQCEYVARDEHEGCDCRTCANDFCETPLTLRTARSLEAYNGVYLHKKCVVQYLENCDELPLISERI